MLLRPNVDCELTPVVGHDVFNKAQMGKARPAKCSIVKLELASNKTTVRVDSSASRGYAKEDTVAARLLFPATEEISVGDRIDIAGMAVRVAAIQPRHSLTGQLDHWQIEGTVWSNG